MILKFTGLQLELLKTALLRPQEGANVAFFIMLKELIIVLRIQKDKVSNEIYSVELTEKQIEFLLQEWLRANSLNVFARAIPNIDINSFIYDIQKIEPILRGAQDVS